MKKHTTQKELKEAGARSRARTAEFYRRAATGQSMTSGIPNVFELKLTKHEAWVILRALSDYAANPRQDEDKQPINWIAERLLKMIGENW